MNIVLIGYRGSGKTTLGKMLANELWKTFVDTDDLVCQRMGGRTIKRIWDEDGEGPFRETECQVVADVLGKDEQVIALGGGTLMQPAAREAVQQAGDAVRIYLKCEAPELHKRMNADDATTATRPNLTGLGGGLEEIQAVLAEREPVYEAVADKVFDVTLLTPQDAIGHLVRRCL